MDFFIIISYALVAHVQRLPMYIHVPCVKDLFILASLAMETVKCLYSLKFFLTFFYFYSQSNSLINTLSLVFNTIP